MSETQSRQHPIVSVAMVAAIVGTAVFAVWLVRFFLRLEHEVIVRRVEGTAGGILFDSHPPMLRAGVEARITAGTTKVQVRLPSVDFALHPGESLDARMSPGPFRAEFTVHFWSGDVSHTRLGAEIQAGKLMILHRGQPVLAEAAGEMVRTVMSSIALPIDLKPDVDEITITFENDGRRPCRLRALWQPLSPEPANEPQPLPVPK